MREETIHDQIDREVARLLYERDHPAEELPPSTANWRRAYLFVAIAIVVVACLWLFQPSSKTEGPTEPEPFVPHGWHAEFQRWNWDCAVVQFENGSEGVYVIEPDCAVYVGERRGTLSDIQEGDWLLLHETSLYHVSIIWIANDRKPKYLSQRLIASVLFS